MVGVRITNCIVYTNETEKSVVLLIINKKFIMVSFKFFTF